MNGTGSKYNFTQLLEDYQNLVFSICVKMTGDYFASEDLAQETFLSAYRHLSEFDGINAKAWLCRIATNKCIDYQREAARRMIATDDDILSLNESPGMAPDELCIEKDVRERLLIMCRRLKPPYDAIAEAFYYEEQSAEEIAVSQEKNIKTIQTQIYRAREMLKNMYRKERKI